MTAGAPLGVVTFLFTDVEGSTRRWEADADAMRTALAAHDEVLRAAIEANGGFMFKHTGDGMCAAFASPRYAVDAAIAAQRKLELPVRTGMATGEAEVRGTDYFGTVLNRAARVMAAGHGGQILVADSTAVLLSGIDLVDLGPRRLRDVSAPVGVFQVRAAGLQTEFPSLRGVDSNPGNLRPAITSLIGRDAEVSNLQAALRSHRLVTLAGVGGVGKTRLALEVATQLADEFVDGVWVFELAAIADPAAVPDAVAAVLGITQQPGKSVSESVASALEGRSRLLVFDNCEHVVDSVADLVAAILAASATVKVLATSREGIGVADEFFWRVPSLDVGAAVELFVERAQSMVSDTLADEATAVEDVCRRLDGIPLAIELAASRMASMTAAEVRDRLDDRFKLLVGSRRGLARHHTLRHAVAWSYDLLDDREKALLHRCSVFTGGFDLQSACAVSGFDDSDDYVVLDLLDALVRKSLLVADRSSGRTRFSMLETIRQFAEEQLVASGGADEARAAHSRYFAGREADILALWDSPRQRDAYAWFTNEMANLRTAAQLTIASGRYEEVPFGFEGVLCVAYLHIGQPERAVEWCRAQLARGRDTRTVTRASLIVSLTLAGSRDEAMAAANGLIDAAEATHNPFVLSFALYVHDAAFRYARDADPAGALDALRRGLVIAQDSGNRFTESLLAGSLCRLEAVYGDPLAALDYITLAIRIYHDSGNTAAVRGALSILAAVFDRLGRYGPAATMAGFAVIPYTAMLAEFNTLIAHLRDVLGDQTYESLARKGETMTTAAMVTYAYDQIDQARAELNAVSK